MSRLCLTKTASVLILYNILEVFTPDSFLILPYTSLIKLLQPENPVCPIEVVILIFRQQGKDPRLQMHPQGIHL